MWPQNPKPRLDRLGVAVFIALVVHAWLIFSDILPLLYKSWSSLIPNRERSKTTEVTMLSLSSREWEQNRRIETPTKTEEKQKKEEPAEEEEKKEEQLEGQVVDIAPTPNTTPPKDSKYLSEYNTQVEKESVSRHQRKDYGVAQSRPTVAEYSKKHSPTEDKGNQDVALLIKKEGRRDSSSLDDRLTFEIPDIKRRQSLHLNRDVTSGTLPTFDASEEFQGNSERLRFNLGKPTEEQKEKKGEEGDHKDSVAQLGKPSLKNFDMVTGAPSNDYIKEAPEGEETLLNSREFKYATFFNRVKRGVSEHWNPGGVYLSHDPYGNIYGVKDRYTVLHVELDPQGKLQDISVGRSSGLNFLDKEAIEAFQNAAPFHNPPRGLADSEGKIRFQFGFYFEIGDRTRIRGFSFGSPGL